MSRRIGIAISLAMAFVVVSLARGEAPKLEYLFPAGGQIGTTVIVTAGGKLDPWPVKAWSPCHGVEIEATTNHGQLSFRLSPDLAPGVYPVRFYNAEGGSTVRAFVAGRAPEIQEKEPNNEWSQAQAVENLPVTVNGRLEKQGDVDCFAVKLQAGRWFVAKVDGFGLGSPIDPFLHLLDSAGQPVAFANDSANADPLLAWKVEKSGTYVLRIAAFAYPPASDVRFAGGAAAVYRITMTDGPYVDRVFPAGGRRGGKVPVQLVGWNLTGNTAEIDLAQTSQADFVDYPPPGSGPNLRFFVGDAPEILEPEPNNRPGDAPEIDPPCVVNGRIDPARDIDWFAFAAKKDDQFDFRARSTDRGFPLDASVAVADLAGKTLATSDGSDSGYQATVLAWTAPADGKFLVRVTDLERRGGSNFIYRLAIRQAAPDYHASLDAVSYAVEAGKSVEIKATIAREHNHQAKLTARVEGTPAGVSIKIGDPPEGGGELKITVGAEESCPPFSGPIRVMIVEVGANPGRSRAARFMLREIDSYGEALINETEDIWLAVTPKVVQAEKKADKK